MFYSFSEAISEEMKLKQQDDQNIRSKLIRSQSGVSVGRGVGVGMVGCTVVY